MSAGFDRQRLTEIAHGAMPYWNPIAEAEVARLCARMTLKAGARVLDVGCGRAEMLIRLLGQSGASGVGVDANAGAIKYARAQAVARLAPGRLELNDTPFEAPRYAPGSFNAVLCVGSTHAAGGLDAALSAFCGLLQPDGFALIGEGYWKRSPDPEYLAHIGSVADELRDHESTLAQFTAVGMRVLDTSTSSDADWNRYEGGYLANTEAHAAAHPADPSAAAMLAHVRGWNDGYRRWGKTTMGFMLVLAQHSPR